MVEEHEHTTTIMGIYTFDRSTRAGHENVYWPRTEMALAGDKLVKIVLVYKMEMHVKTVLEQLRQQTWNQNKEHKISIHILDNRTTYKQHKT